MEPTTSDPEYRIVRVVVGDTYCGVAVAVVSRRKTACVVAGVGLALALGASAVLHSWSQERKRDEFKREVTDRLDRLGADVQALRHYMEK